MRWFGAPPDEFTPERPRRGPEVNPDAVDALDRIVLALELRRYAEREPGASRVLVGRRGDLRASRWSAARPLRARRRAEWWPRSVFVRERPSSRRADGDERRPRPAYAGSSTTSAESRPAGWAESQQRLTCIS